MKNGHDCRPAGFTLVEVIVVILVMLMLGGITCQQFLTAWAKTRDVQRKSDLNELSQSIRMYYADYKKLPSEQLINGLWGKQWMDGSYIYMKQVPRENYLKVPYCYLVSEDGKSFILLADLEYKADPDCKKEKQKCSKNSYCFMDKFDAEIKK